MSQRIILQPHDIAILEDLFISRIMTSLHIAKLYFGGKTETTKKNLQKLKQAGLVKARERKVNEPAILHLTRAGHHILEAQGILNRYPCLSLTAIERRVQVSKFTLEHELAVLDIKAAMIPAIIPPLHCITFSTWPRLHTFAVTHPRTRTRKAIAPDGFIKLQEGKRLHHFFLEVDRSTESLTLLLDKVLAYGAHYRNGGFAASQGTPRTDFAVHPFRVLFVVKSPERRDNLAQHLLANHILTQTWITTQNEVCDNPLGNIWVRPADYRKAANPLHGVCNVEKHPLFPQVVRPELN